MKKTSILLLSMALAAQSAMAVPAQRIFRTYTQPDGSEIVAMATGDEFCRSYIDQNGNTLLEDAQGFLRPASADEIEQLRAASPLLANKEKALSLRRNVIKTSRAEATDNELPQHGMGLFSKAGFYPLTGNVRSLVFLVEYQDIKFSMANPREYFSASLNEEGFSRNEATGSARDYFLKQSGGLFDPSFDVYGPVTLSRERAYYGGNDRGGDMHPEEMVTEAAAALASEIDYSLYDLDNDGFIDNIYVIYAGVGENSSNVKESVWPHSSGVYSEEIYNGKMLLSYACSNEVFGDRTCGIGTFIHEYSHVLGLPDLYNTTSVQSYTPNRFDVMDQGSYNNNQNTPPNYSSYERNALRWMRPVPLTEACTISLDALEDKNEAYIIQTGIESEFFLLENRQKKGNDAYIPAGGMLIWHIDFDQDVWDMNRVNNSRTHQHVDIVEAGGKTSTSYNDYSSSYTFPGSAGVTSFTSTTKPALVDWYKNAIDMPITNITEHPDGRITFDVKGGSNGVTGIEAAGTLSVIAEGMQLTVSSTPMTEVAVYGTDGTLRARTVTDSEGKANIELNTRGLYIVHALGEAVKTVL